MLLNFSDRTRTGISELISRCALSQYLLTYYSATEVPHNFGIHTTDCSWLAGLRFEDMCILNFFIFYISLNWLENPKNLARKKSLEVKRLKIDEVLPWLPWAYEPSWFFKFKIDLFIHNLACLNPCYTFVSVLYIVLMAISLMWIDGIKGLQAVEMVKINVCPGAVEVVGQWYCQIAFW